MGHIDRQLCATCERSLCPSRAHSHFRLFERTALVVGGGVYRHCTEAGVEVIDGDANG